MKNLFVSSKQVWLGVFLSLVLPVMAFAGGNSCATATGLIPDGRVLSLDYVQPTSPNNVAWYSFNATAGHSYSVEVHDDLDGVPAVPLVITFYSAACATPMTIPTPSNPQTYTSSQYRDTSTIEPAVIANTGMRISIPNPNTDTVAIKVVNNDSSGHYVSVSVSETTIFSSAWNTCGGYGTQFIFQNTTSSSVTYNLALTATINGPATYTSQFTLTAPPTSSSNKILNMPGSFNPNTIPSPCQAGYAVLTHDGAPGSIQTYENENNFGASPAPVTPVLFLIPMGPTRGK